MALSLGKRVLELLKEKPGEAYTARQIAEWIAEKFPDECEDKKKRSQAVQSDDDLVAQLASEIGALRPALQKKNPGLRTTEGRPRKYSFVETAHTEGDEDGDASERFSLSPAQPGASGQALAADQPKGEYRLYQILASYLCTQLNVYAKRINERRSANRYGRNGNQWLHPDLVGIEDLGSEWSQEVKDCVREYADKRSKLWSFEVKLRVDRSNVRQSFFQAVSNSSWAHYGYLVTSELAGDDDTLKELRVLSAAHGIGLILLNAEEAPESQILIPARERAEVDWSAANRIASENSDFRAYVKLVRQFCQTGELKEADWGCAQIA